nr:MAG TPA: hypothetical protein [Microviridae sp.]
MDFQNQNQTPVRRYKVTVASEKNYEDAPAAVLSFMPECDDISAAIDSALCYAESCFVAMDIPREDISLIVVSVELTYI